jgi:hypothetical protein
MAAAETDVIAAYTNISRLAVAPLPLTTGAKSLSRGTSKEFTRSTADCTTMFEIEKNEF